MVTAWEPNRDRTPASLPDQCSTDSRNGAPRADRNPTQEWKHQAKSHTRLFSTAQDTTMTGFFDCYEPALARANRSELIEPGSQNGLTDRCFVEQSFSGPHQGVLMKPPLQYTVAKQVDDG
jgi:hypothetical protein